MVVILDTVVNLLGFVTAYPVIVVAGLAVFLYIGFKILKGLVRIVLLGAAVVWIFGVLTNMLP